MLLFTNIHTIWIVLLKIFPSFFLILCVCIGLNGSLFWIWMLIHLYFGLDSCVSAVFLMESFWTVLCFGYLVHFDDFSKKNTYFIRIYYSFFSPDNFCFTFFFDNFSVKKSIREHFWIRLFDTLNFTSHQVFKLSANKFFKTEFMKTFFLKGCFFFLFDFLNFLVFRSLGPRNYTLLMFSQYHWTFESNSCSCGFKYLHSFLSSITFPPSTVCRTSIRIVRLN